jgi:hypothetical protein
MKASDVDTATLHLPRQPIEQASSTLNQRQPSPISRALFGYPTSRRPPSGPFLFLLKLCKAPMLSQQPDVGLSW